MMGDSEPSNPLNPRKINTRGFKLVKDRPPPHDINNQPNEIKDPKTLVKEKTDDFHDVGTFCSFACPEGTQETYDLEAEPIYNKYINSKDMIIGEGSFETKVIQYEAKGSNMTSLTVAIKLINITNSQSKTRQYMIRERKIIEKLTQSQCEHTVKYFSSMKCEGLFWIIMEKMDVDLKKFIIAAHDLSGKEKQPKVPLCFLKKLIFCLIEGLSYLHSSMHKIHRDIKPNNILLRQSPNLIKICDFGIAGELTESNNAKSVGTGNSKWLAPERLLVTKKFRYNEKSDIWSAGLTILNVIIGQFPYGESATKADIIHDISKNKMIEAPNAELYAIPIRDNGTLSLAKQNPNNSFSNEKMDVDSPVDAVVTSTSDNIAMSSHSSSYTLTRLEKIPGNKHHIEYKRPNNTTNPLMNFLEKCLIHKSDSKKQSRHSSKFIESAGDMIYRADYKQLKRDKFYQDIVANINTNNGDKDELAFFFSNVFSHGFENTN